MSKIGYCIACALLFVNAFAEPLEAQEIKSPDGELFLKVNVDDNGQPVYSLKYKGNPLVNKSHLGLSGKEADFVKGFAVQHVDSTTFDEVWEPVWGEYSKVRNHYNEMSVTFSKNDTLMRVRFRLFNDGLGFRYEFPEQLGVNYLTLMDESTEFNMPGDYTM